MKDSPRNRYFGRAAINYDSIRNSVPKWEKENLQVRNALKNATSSGETILDIPVGTGRFANIYTDLGLIPTGADISDDMLEIAARKLSGEHEHVWKILIQSDILNLKFNENEFNHSICFRLGNWLSVKELESALLELRRVTSRHIFLGIRTWELRNTKNSLFDYLGSLFRFLQLKLGRQTFNSKRTVFSSQKLRNLFMKLSLKIEFDLLIETRGDSTIYKIYCLSKLS